ncbi:NEAT domain-containing protein [Paenibacillus sp. WQ 127069]|uniref:NEAT domain-containing protein n=1 Tax=Paenibacillus baimaensis TaxID=2982185 RepID=A0ABT2UBC2_9BACL|nr:NEAT domain-containing protein [Paenibacillus sp. WQ 127069]MCU6790974.1 NEAT domain-containing protein [Paenibacillus sp. WQ 127069]
MNAQFKKVLSSLLILFVLLAGIPLPDATAASNDPTVQLKSATTSVYGGNKLSSIWQSVGNVTNSVYQQVYGYEATISFNPNEMELSGATAQNQFNTPVKTEVAPGKYLVTFDIKDRSNPVSITSETSFQLLSLSVQTKATSQISNVTIQASDISIINKDGSKLKVDDCSFTFTVNPTGSKDQLNALIAQVDSAREGIYNGQYTVGSMTSFTTILNASKTISNGNQYSQERIDQQVAQLQAAYQELQAHLITNNPVPALQDGEYKLDFMIYSNKTNQQSVMYTYVDKDSGKLTVAGGKKYVSFTLKQNAEILSLKTTQNGALVDTKVISKDLAANTRVVEFEVEDLSKRLEGWVKIYWWLTPTFLYDNEYSIEFGFSNVISEQNVNFTALHATKDQASSMDSYFNKPAKWKVQDGKNKVSFTINNSTVVPSFKVDQNGTMVEATTVSTDTAANTRVVEFEVSDMTTLLNAVVHVSTSLPNGSPYEMDHSIRLRFEISNKTSLKTLITDAQAFHDAAVEGSANGQYPAGAKSTLLVAINQAKTTSDSTSATQQQVDEAQAALQAALTVFKAAVVVVTNPGTGTGGLADGEYAVSFNIYKKGTNENSVMYDYVDKNSGKLTVAGGKKYISFKLLQSAEITSFKTEQAGILTETAIVSKDATNNTRIIKFEVNDLNARLNGWVKIYWQVTPTFLYDNEYDVELGFSNVTTEREINFTALHATRDQASSMDSYFNKPAKWKIQDGKNKVSFTINNSTVVPSFKVEQNGTMMEATTVSTDTAANTRVVEFEVSDMTALLNAVVHVSTSLPNGSPYEMDHSIRLKFIIVNTNSLQALIAEAQAIHDAAVEGTNHGQYPTGAKSTLLVAINEAKTTAGNTSATQQQVDGALSSLQTALNAFKVVVVDKTIDLTQPVKNGEYSVTFKAAASEDGSGTPISNYVDNGGTLKVVNGKKMAAIKLKSGVTVSKIQLIKTDGTKSELLPQYSLKQSGVVRILAAEESSRQVEFETEDLTATYAIQLKGSGGEEHTFKLEFDKVIAVNVPDDSTTPTTPTTPGTGTSGSGSSGGGGSGGGSGTVPSTLVDGKYSMNLTIFKSGTDEKSIIQDYVQSPGIVRVIGGKQYVSFIIKQSKKITEMKMEQNGSLSEVSVLSKDELKNTREIEYEVKDLSARSKGTVKLAQTAVNDVQSFDVEIAYDKSSMTAIDQNATLTSITESGQPTVNPTAGQIALSDIQNHWSKAAIGRALALGIVTGYEDGSFRPDGEINRAEFTVMISRALKLEGKATELTFADLSSIPAWVKPHLAQTVGAGIITSYEDQTFRADRKISRSEIAVMIGRALKLPSDEKETLSFADAEQVPSWARAYVAAAAKQGIINGRDNNLFAPHASATRAEAVTLIGKLLDQVK